MTTPPRMMRITTAPVSLKVLLKGQLGFIQRKNFDVLAVSSAGSEVTDILSQNIPHRIIPMTRSITPFQDLYCLFLLVRLMIWFKPQIVHTHTPKAGLLGMMAAFICRVPIRIHTIAGLPLMETTGWKRKILKATERITYSLAHRLYPNSFGLLEFIRQEFKLSSNSKFKVIGNGSSNGIDTTYFSRTDQLEMEAKQIRLKYNVPIDTLVFGFVGRMVKDKGIIELVEAFIRMSSFTEARLMLVGDFEHHLDPLPQSTLDFLKNDSRIIAPGFQQDVRPWLMAMDVFAFPSYREGFPNAVMQACSLEVPCIVSNINGCNEIIVNKVSGLIISPKDSETLFEAMKLMAEHPDLRKSFAGESRKHVVAHFDQAYLWNQLILEYNQLLKGRCVHE